MSLFTAQAYDLYSAEDHYVWRRLHARLQPRWYRYAHRNFLDGLHRLQLDPFHIPRLAAVNRFLEPLTGFRARAVAGYVPAFTFFDCLRRREFPTTVAVRPAEQMDYLPEPDIFHDVAGHVPMHTDRAFAEALVRFGDCAHTAVELTAELRDEREKLRRLDSMLRAMARFFWFTVEFGLLREGREIKACGSGLLSSYGELEHAVQSPAVARVAVDLERAVNQPFEIDHYQPLLMVLDSFDQLYELAGTLERWMRAGRLDRVAPGEPRLPERDLRSFVEAEEAVLGCATIAS